MNRIYSLDLAKAIGISLVIFTHLKETMGFAGEGYLRTLMYLIDRLGVPFFFMVSGVLLLGKEQTPSGKTLKRIASLITGVALISITTNFLYSHLFDGIDSIFINIKYNNTITTSDTYKAYQLWYMFYYILLFLIAIPLSAFTSRASIKSLLVLCISLFFLGPISQLLSAHYFSNRYISIASETELFSYLLYMCLGLYIYRLKKHSTFLTRVFLGLVIVFTIISSAWITSLNPDRFNDNTWYSKSIPIFTSSALCFYLMTSFKSEPCKTLLIKFSNNSYGMYLIHMMIIYIYLYFAGHGISNAVIKFLGVVFVFTISFFLSLSLNKTKLKAIFS